MRSLDRIDGQGRNWKGRILKPKSRIDKTGYLNVSLCKSGTHSKEIHRLVLEAFIGPCPLGMVACHNNGNAYDNKLSNLRWDTPRNNAIDTIRHGNNVSMKCIRRSDGYIYESLQEAARDLNKDASNISKAALGKIKTAYGFSWEYVI